VEQVQQTPQSVMPDPVLDDGDHDVFSHIVNKADLARAQFGEPIQALCGKVWVPRRNPDNYPLCKTCIDMWERLSARGEN
jgi:hypothetical protein